MLFAAQSQIVGFGVERGSGGRRTIPAVSRGLGLILVSSLWPNRGRGMAGDPKARARKSVRRAQADFEKAQDRLEALREIRRKDESELLFTTPNRLHLARAQLLPRAARRP